MGAPLWLRVSVGGLSRLSPIRAARLANAFFRRPSMTPGLSPENLARMEKAEALMKEGEMRETVVEGRRLASYHFRPAIRPEGLVLLLHGWSGDARAMAAFIPPLLGAGYEILAVDLPAHGRSGGEETDAVEAARLVHGLLIQLNHAPDHVIAHSYGGSVAGLIAERGAVPRGFVSLASPTRFALVLDEIAAAFALSPLARRRFEIMAVRQLRRRVDDLDALKVWGRRATRILVLHGPDDARVSYAHAEHLAQAPNVALTPLPGIDHCSIVFNDASIKAAITHIRALDSGRDLPLIRDAA